LRALALIESFAAIVGGVESGHLLAGLGTVPVVERTHDEQQWSRSCFDGWYERPFAG
jgi:hypothetical protein